MLHSRPRASDGFRFQYVTNCLSIRDEFKKCVKLYDLLCFVSHDFMYLNAHLYLKVIDVTSEAISVTQKKTETKYLLIFV